MHSILAASKSISILCIKKTLLGSALCFAILLEILSSHIFLYKQYFLKASSNKINLCKKAKIYTKLSATKNKLITTENIEYLPNMSIFKQTDSDNTPYESDQKMYKMYAYKIYTSIFSSNFVHKYKQLKIYASYSSVAIIKKSIIRSYVRHFKIIKIVLYSALKQIGKKWISILPYALSTILLVILKMVFLVQKSTNQNYIIHTNSAPHLFKLLYKSFAFLKRIKRKDNINDSV